MTNKRKIVIGPDIVWTVQPSEYVFTNKIGDNRWNILCAGSIFEYDAAHPKMVFIEKYTHDQMIYLVNFFMEHGNKCGLSAMKYVDFLRVIGGKATHLDVIDDTIGRNRFYDESVLEWKIKMAQAHMQKIFFCRRKVVGIIKTSIISLK